ncbi:TatD family hydrolase [Paraflavisolibacter sp. H34]|uniref:TatD family hydrolase n=1 Tax=Huijunlia imazamoxiresistens TaxID=3127457 RepID=UPI0030190905
MQIIDTHAHLYTTEFDADRPAVMEAAVRAGVGPILLPAIDGATHEAMLRVEAEYPVCKAMMGLHPCHVKENYEEELKLVQEYLARRPFVAVGEIGLDFHWDTTFMEQQYDAFHRQIRMALEYGLPISIHSRKATEESIEVIRQYPGLRGVFHCFSGTTAQAEALIGLGFYLGIGGVVTYKNSDLGQVIGAVGLSNVILETDAPYLAPVPKRGKRNESAYLTFVIDKISNVLGRGAEEISKITTENAKKLFVLS